MLILIYFREMVRQKKGTHSAWVFFGLDGDGKGFTHFMTLKY